MDFFACQDRARKRTIWLVIAFCVSIIIIIAAIDAFIYLYNKYYNVSIYADKIINMHTIMFLNLGILFFILVGTISSFIQFRAGGKSIVKMTNAVLVNANNKDFKIKQLLNIVAEMSLASGVIAPSVYVLENELSINAFVSGYNPNDTVLVVTRGALDNLTRDELQGVIAHEYSHIFNSDTVINLRLLVVLGGLLVLSEIGYLLMRGGAHAGSSKRKAESVIFVVFVGAVLYICGILGLLCGNVIRAAISRTRESLADASSVQYTRDPSGLLMALIKIDEQQKDKYMQNVAAERINHLCFTKATKMNFLLDTHPPIAQRIAALDPHNTIRQSLQQKKRFTTTQTDKVNNNSRTMHDNVVLGAQIATAAVLNNIGNPSAASFIKAKTMVDDLLSPELQSMLADNDTVQALIYAISVSMSTDPDQALASLQVPEPVHAMVNAALSIPQLKLPRYRAALINLSIPTLRTLNEQDKASFYKNVKQLLDYDKTLNLPKALLLSILQQRLKGDAFGSVNYIYHDFSAISREITCVLWFVAKCSADSSAAQAQAFAFASQDLQQEINRQPDYDLNTLITSLSKLSLMQPHLKQRFLSACVRCIMQDKVVNNNEEEIIRGICMCLNCPMPQLDSA